MFELTGTNFEKGVFDLRLESAGGGGWLSRFVALGPVKGRLVALVFFVLAGFLVYFRGPAELAMRMGWADSAIDAMRIQGFVVWGIVILGLVFYFIVLGMRRERLDLTFDRAKAQVRYRWLARAAFSPAKEAIAPFSAIEAMEVFGPEREPRSPHGFLELRVRDLEEPFRILRFRFLTDEQRRFYPLNLAKLTDRQPQGDWVDPEA